MTAETNGPADNPSVPITDSPWFWAYVFATAALVALFLAGPRYIERQPQLERQFSARQSGGQVIVGRDGPVPPSTSDRMILSLQPLYFALGGVLILAWIGLWYFRLRPGAGRDRRERLPNGAHRNAHDQIQGK
ncbi:MAG: hypothetical protein KDB23_32120 [Planctomycetales bacterium]|nr:hypothetical protein [Planctomycetales bacterium]